MSVSIGTVKSHRESAMRKLGARSSVELLTLAIRRGLVDVNSPTQEGINEEN
jgi:DNA-binding CsgD family transcriptional regulator